MLFHPETELHVNITIKSLYIYIFRTYERWKEATEIVGRSVNLTLMVFHQAACWFKDKELVDDFKRWCIVWFYCHVKVMKNSSSLHLNASSVLHPEELAALNNSPQPGPMAMLNLRELFAEADLSPEQFRAMESSLTVLWNLNGQSVRIRRFAIPHGLSLMCTGLVQV